MAKDSNGLEVVRNLEATDPVYAPIANRPHNDLIQRDVDLLGKHTPAGHFKVSGTSPASNAVSISAGKYIQGSTTGASQQIVSYPAVASTSAISPASGGNIKKTLVSYSLVSGTYFFTDSGETAEGNGFGSITDPDTYSLGAGNAIFLAILNVDDTPTPFDLSITDENAAGYIKDMRTSQSPGVLPSTDIPADIVPGFNSSGTLKTASTSTLKGVAGLYARGDHTHELPRHLAGPLGGDLLTGGMALALYGGGRSQTGIVTTVTSVLGGISPQVNISLASDTAPSAAPLVIPANTFPNGILVRAHVMARLQTERDAAPGSDHFFSAQMWANVTLTQGGNVIHLTTTNRVSNGVNQPLNAGGNLDHFDQDLPFFGGMPPLFGVFNLQGAQDSGGAFTGMVANASGEGIWTSQALIESARFPGFQDVLKNSPAYFDPTQAATIDFEKVYFSAVDAQNPYLTDWRFTLGDRMFLAYGF